MEKECYNCTLLMGKCSRCTIKAQSKEIENLITTLELEGHSKSFIEIVRKIPKVTQEQVHKHFDHIEKNENDKLKKENEELKNLAKKLVELPKGVKPDEYYELIKD